MNKKLLLWDVDGTLVLTGKAGVAAFLQALERLHGVKATMDGVDYPGRTDTRIARDLLRRHGIENTPEKEKILVNGYLEELEKELPRRNGGPLPGVRKILEEMGKREDIVLGLLTGNFERGAKLKLGHYGIWHYFLFGAFADDSDTRNDLGPIALRRARDICGIEFNPEQVFIIGDTPHDVECGKIIDAQTIAVATGSYSVENLAAHKPTAVFKNFENTKDFFKVVDASPKTANV